MFLAVMGSVPSTHCVSTPSLHDANGTPIGGEKLDSPENKIVARYEDRLGWSSRDEGLAYAYSVTEVREITDIEGTGTLDPDFADHPGLFQFQ